MVVGPLQWGLGRDSVRVRGSTIALPQRDNTSALTLFTRQSYAAAKTEPKVLSYAAAKKAIYFCCSHLLQPPIVSLSRFTCGLSHRARRACSLSCLLLTPSA